MKKALALLTAATFGFTLGTVFADEATVSPLQQQPASSPMVVATSKEQSKQTEKKEKKRKKKEKKREKKEKKKRKKSKD